MTTHKIDAKRPTPITVSVADAASMTGLSEWTIRDLVYRGRIDARRHGRRVLVVREALRAYVDGLEQVVAA